MDELNLPVAVLLSVSASIAFAGAAVLQHEAIGSQVAQRDTEGQQGQPRILSVGFFRSLLQRPLWWIGFGLSGVGALLNLTALSGAPVSVVQPITVLSVPFAVLLGMWRNHRRPGRVVWLAILGSLVGVTCFVGLAANNTTSHPPAATHILWSGLVTAALVAVLLVAGQRGPGWVRSLSWACGAAACYGLAAAYMKAIFVQLEHGAALTSPTVWLPGLVLLLAYPAAAYMLQHGFVSGAPEVVIGGLTVVDPILAVLIGAFLLGEGSRVSPGVLVVMLGCAGLAVAGVVLLSRYHPDAQRSQDEEQHSQNTELPSQNKELPSQNKEQGQRELPSSLGTPSPHDPSTVESERNTR